MLQKLPNDILYNLVKCVRYNKETSKITFKLRLWLLRIFRRLRHVALPQVYRFLYIDNCRIESPLAMAYKNKYNSDFHACIDTNADLIALGNHTHMVKVAHIHVDHEVDPYTELSTMLAALKACENQWLTINTLAITMSYSEYAIMRSEAHFSWYTKESAECSRALVDIIPCVTELLFDDNNCSDVIYNFFDHVAALYAHRLVKVTNICHNNVTSKYKFERLQYMQMYMFWSGLKLPNVNCRTLVSLHIAQLPSNVSWDSFLEHKGDRIIEFACLKHLNLRFRSKEDINDNTGQHAKQNYGNLTLNFPALSTLHIECKEAECPFLKLAVFPVRMDSVTIKAHPKLLDLFEDMHNPIANNITMSS